MATITIALFDRRPVKFDEDNWPVIASTCAFDDERNPAQANREWHIEVRQQRQETVDPKRPHLTPRRIVYGWYASAWQHETDQRGGYLIDCANAVTRDDRTLEAIKNLVGRLTFPDRLADEVIAGLPAEVL